MYSYRALIKSVYDGDTVRADIDLGFSHWISNEQLRLFGIDAPELRGDERTQGLVTRDYLINRIGNRAVEIQTVKDKKGKYGRYLAIIYLDGVNINEELIDKSLAVKADY